MPSYPSVTQAISGFADFSMVPPITLQLAAARGTRVHSACTAHALGLWCPPLPADEQGYLDSFVKWFDLAVAEVAWCEKELIDEGLGFRGHPDLLCKVKGDTKLTLIDLKTPAAKLKAWRAQLAGYWHLCESNGYGPIGRVASLRLKPKGGMPIFDDYGLDTVDLNALIQAVQAWRYFNE